MPNTQKPKQDVERDRNMLQMTLDAFRDESVANELGIDFAATVMGCAGMALDYLTRTAETEAELDLNTKLLAGVVKERDHARRMVEAAIDFLACRVDCCPFPFERPSECDDPTEQTTSACKLCIRDYLDQKAKEEER